jgi:purine-binding chemotaxis protein CheW
VSSTVGGLSLLFRSNAARCAVGLDEVVEVTRPLPVTPVTEDGAAFVDGVCVVHGVPVPVVNVGSLLGGERSRPTRFVVVRDGGRQVALAVDEVLGIREVPADSLHDLSPLLAAAKSELVATLGVVDAEPLLFLRDVRLVPDSVWRALPKEWSSQ